MFYDHHLSTTTIGKFRAQSSLEGIVVATASGID